MAPRLGALMACIAATRCLAAEQHQQQCAALVLLQQRVQRLTAELPLNDSFAQAILEAEQQGAAEQQAFRSIHQRLMDMEASLVGERERHIVKYKHEIEAATKETRAVQLSNLDLESQLKSVDRYNAYMSQTALALEEQSKTLDQEVRKRHATLSSTIKHAAAALKKNEKRLQVQSAELEEQLKVDTHHHPKISLLSLGEVSPRTHKELLDSLQWQLWELMQSKKRSDVSLKAAFDREINALLTERNGYLKYQMQLNKSLADANARAVRFSTVVRNFETTKQHLLSVKSSLPPQLPEIVAGSEPTTEAQTMPKAATDLSLLKSSINGSAEKIGSSEANEAMDPLKELEEFAML